MYTSEMLDRTSPEYIAAVVKKKSQEDPKETAIRKKIEAAVLREPWTRDVFLQVKELQIAYLRRMIANIDRPDLIHDETQQALAGISKLLRSKIVEGTELLARIPAGSPVLIMTNHFGAYKLTAISPSEDLGVNIPDYNAMYPYLAYFAALYPVAAALGDSLSYVSEDFPTILGQIHTAAGFIFVPPAKIEVDGGRTHFLQVQTQGAINTHPCTAFVNFPEGGTSGKYTGLGPYDLDPFKTGGYAVAKELKIHVIPVAQYFDPIRGFQLKILPPFIPSINSTKEDLEGIAQGNREVMQTWFDEKTKIDISQA